MDGNRITLRQAVGERILLLDGAMGTMIQTYGLGEADFRGSRFTDVPGQMQGNNDLLSLTRPDVGFTLSHNGRDIHVLRPAKSHKYRIQDLLGSSAVDKVVDIAAETSVVSVNGYVCRPDLARKTVGNQFFFVNGRYFRSPYLHKAVMRAYEGMVSEGAVPSYFIWLKVDPRSMDVNIHPTKTEIKFEDDSVIFQVLSACIREALGRNSFGGGIDFEQAADAPEMPVFGKKFDEYRPEYRPDSAFQSDYNPFETGSGEYAAAGATGGYGAAGDAGATGGYGATGAAGGPGGFGASAGGAKGQDLRGTFPD